MTMPDWPPRRSTPVGIPPGDRGISTVLTYTLALLVVTLLTTTVFVGVGGVVENQNQEATHSSMEVIGHRLASDVRTADRLAIAAGSGGTVELTAGLPERAGGSQYRVTIDDVGGDRYELRVRSDDPEVTVVVTVRSQTPIDEGSFVGGDVVIRYESGELVVSHAST